MGSHPWGFDPLPRHMNNRGGRSLSWACRRNPLPRHRASFVLSSKCQKDTIWYVTRTRSRSTTYSQRFSYPSTIRKCICCPSISCPFWKRMDKPQAGRYIGFTMQRVSCVSPISSTIHHRIETSPWFQNRTLPTHYTKLFRWSPIGEACIFWRWSTFSVHH